MFYSGWFFANAVLHAGPDASDLTLPPAAEASAALLALAGLVFALGAGAAIALFFGFLPGAAPEKNDSVSAPPADDSHALILTPAGAILKIASVALALVLAALHTKVCLFERVEVSGSSMYPTLKNGEVIWIEKLSTGLQIPDLSFPFGTLSPTGKLPAFGLGNFRRGDVVVFRYPGVSADENDYYIKRVIGLAGDQYEIAGGRVYINGEELPEPYLPASTRTLARPRFAQPAVDPLPRELDLLQPDVRESALFGAGRRGEIPGHTILVMGDNRELSRDSRSIGFIPVFYILGVALHSL
ncbi:MAG: signal peptidase I [Leptospirales bacterium]